MVEFALVIPLLMALVLGIIDYGLCFNDSISVRQGVREAGPEGGRADRFPGMHGLYRHGRGRLRSQGDGHLQWGHPRACAPNESGGDLLMTGQATLHITAPTSGPTAGLAVVSDRNNTSELGWRGNGSDANSGTIYIKSGTLNYRGNGAGKYDDSLIVVGDFDFSGNQTDFRMLRTWVLAAPMRSPAAVVREVKALQQLSDGRFELGIGTGRPDAAAEAERLGVPWPSASERVAQVETVVTAIREQVDPRPPVVMAASGAKSLAVAGRVADRVAVALDPRATLADLEAGAARVREAAPHVSLTLQAFGVGDRVPEYLRRQGFSAGDLTEARSIVMLPTDPAAIADQLRQHADTFGVDEVVIPSDFVREVAPAIALV
ncbi:MAG: LLM class flavin-dependent oxidoreductase [Lapillicoccus sp.]